MLPSDYHVYYPQSNGRAEAAVKSIKRLINGNTGNRGSINTDQIAQALLQHCNTPLRDINLSPAQLALGRELRDTMPLPRNQYKVDKRWSSQLQQREKIMLENHLKIGETYNSHAESPRITNWHQSYLPKYEEHEMG